MILLPYAHEKQTVQRLPWVTFILIAINVVVFFFTHFNGINQQDAEGIVGEFQEYYYTHPYLEVPPEMQRFFTKKDLEQIALLKEGTDFTQISAETRREEQ